MTNSSTMRSVPDRSWECHNLKDGPLGLFLFALRLEAIASKVEAIALRLLLGEVPCAPPLPLVLSTEARYTASPLPAPVSTVPRKRIRGRRYTARACQAKGRRGIPFVAMFLVASDRSVPSDARSPVRSVLLLLVVRPGAPSSFLPWSCFAWMK